MVDSSLGGNKNIAMINVHELLSQELSLGLKQVQNALQLFADGATVPFIARYRKEKTGEMNEVQLRILIDRFAYLTELEGRKASILQSIAEQGKLTEELKAKIEACLQKTELEDLYLPFRPKKRTRAIMAKGNGLEPLALFIKSLNVPDAPPTDLGLRPQNSSPRVLASRQPRRPCRAHRIFLRRKSPKRRSFAATCAITF